MKKEKFFFLLIFIYFVACSTDLPHQAPYDPDSPPQNQAVSTLSGRIILEGETDFSAVPVKLVGIGTKHGAETTTNKDGTFIIPDVIPGKYRLIVSERFFKEKSFEVSIGIGESKNVGEILVPVKRFKVIGKVVLQELNRNEVISPEGTIVILQRKGGVKNINSIASSSPFYPTAYSSLSTTNTYITTADNSGMFSADEIPAGVYKVMIQHEGYAPKTMENIVVGRENSVVNDLGEIYLPKVSGTFQIVGYLKDGEGNFTVEDYFYSATRSVKLNLYGFSATKMKIGNKEGGICNYGDWKGFDAEEIWELPPGNGEKVVCVKFKDAAGNETKDLYGKIYLDTIPPRIYIFRVINNGEVTTYGNRIYFRGKGDLPLESTVVDGESGISEMKIIQDESISSWIPYREFSSITIAGEGKHIITACFRDYAHNQTCTTLTLIRDSIPPEGSIPSIINSNRYGKVKNVTVQLHIDDYSSDVKDVLLSNTASFAGGYEIPPANDITWYLIPGDGVKTIYLKYIDYAGNESQIYSVTVTLDTTPPDVPDIWRTGFYPDVITMEWSHPNDSDVSYYELQRKIYGFSTSYVTVSGKIPAKQFSFADRDIISGYRYYYRIRAIDDVGNISQWSAPFNAGTPIEPFSWAFYVQTQEGGNVIWQLPKGTILTMGSSYHYVLPGVYGEDVLSVNATLYPFALTTPQENRIFSYLQVRNQNIEGDMIWENKIYYGISDKKISSSCSTMVPFKDQSSRIHFLCINFSGLAFYIYHLYPLGSSYATEYVFSDIGAINGIKAIFDENSKLRIFISYSKNVELPEHILYELIKDKNHWVKYTFVNPGNLYLKLFDVTEDSTGNIYAAWGLMDDAGELTLYYSNDITELINSYSVVVTCPSSFILSMKLLLTGEDTPIILHSICSPDGYANHLSESIFNGISWYTSGVTRGILKSAAIDSKGKVEMLYEKLASNNYYSDHFAYYGEKDNSGWKFMRIHNIPVSENSGTLSTTIFDDTFVVTYGNNDSTLYLSYKLQGKSDFETIRLLKQNVNSANIFAGFGRELSILYRNEDDNRLHLMKIKYFSHLSLLLHDYDGNGGWDSNILLSSKERMYIAYEAEDTDGYEYLHLNQINRASEEDRIVSPEVNYIRVGKFVQGKIVDGKIHLFYLHQRSTTDLMELVHLYGMDTDWTLNVIDSRVSSDLSGNGLGFPDFAVSYYNKVFYIFYYDAPQQLNIAWSSYPYTDWKIKTLISNVEQGVTGLGLCSCKEGIYPIYIYRGNDNHYRMMLLYAYSPYDDFTSEELPLPLGVGNMELRYVDGVLHLFYNGGDADLIHAYKLGGNWKWEVVDSNGNAGDQLSVVVDDFGLFHLAYRSDSTSGLFVKYAFGTTGFWKNFTVDKVWNPRNTSITIFNSRPYMTYIYGKQNGIEQLKLRSPGRYLHIENRRIRE